MPFQQAARDLLYSWEEEEASLNTAGDYWICIVCRAHNELDEEYCWACGEDEAA